MRKLTWKISAAFLAFIVLAGCWDRVEIDQRGFVIGVAIDVPRSSDKAKEGTTADKYRITYQFVIPSGLHGSSANDSGRGDRPYFNTTVQEGSMASLLARMSLRTSRLPFMEHLKTIVVSSEIARREGLDDLFDYYLRDNDMRRSTHVIVSRGEAKKLLELEVPNEPLPAMFLNTFNRNRRLSSYIAEQIRVGDIQEKLLRYETFVVQLVTYKNKQEATFDSVAIFDGVTNKMAGELREEDVQALNFMKGNVEGGIVNFELDRSLVSYQVDRSKRKIELTSVDADRLAFTIKISVDGTLNETSKLDDFTSLELFEQAEQAVAQEIKERCEKTAKKLQQDIRKDAIGLELYLYRNYYGLWKKIHKQWDHGSHLFSQATIEFQVDAKVRRSGNIVQIRGE